jgi:hypothetical protein
MNLVTGLSLKIYQKDKNIRELLRKPRFLILGVFDAPISRYSAVSLRIIPTRCFELFRYYLISNRINRLET